jgi:hypothetical protein
LWTAPLHEPAASLDLTGFPQRGPRDALAGPCAVSICGPLFRYQLSYMIYSDLFDAMPRPILDRVYGRLHEVLTGKDRSPRYASRSAADGNALIEIVRSTKTNVPGYW